MSFLFLLNFNPRNFSEYLSFFLTSGKIVPGEAISVKLWARTLSRFASNFSSLFPPSISIRSTRKNYLNAHSQRKLLLDTYRRNPKVKSYKSYEVSEEKYSYSDLIALKKWKMKALFRVPLSFELTLRPFKNPWLLHARASQAGVQWHGLRFFIKTWVLAEKDNAWRRVSHSAIPCNWLERKESFRDAWKRYYGRRISGKLASGAFPLDPRVMAPLTLLSSCELDGDCQKLLMRTLFKI